MLDKKMKKSSEVVFLYQLDFFAKLLGILVLAKRLNGVLASSRRQTGIDNILIFERKSDYA